MAGVDIPIPELQLTLHQPRIKDIAYVGEQNFLLGTQCLCINKNSILQDKVNLDNTSNFQIFMTVLNDPKARKQKKSVVDILSILFPNYRPLFTPRSLAFSPQGQEGTNIIIDEKTFDYIQEPIRYVCCLKGSRGEQTNFNPADKRAQEIAKKLMRGRERVAAQKSPDQSNSVIAQYVSVLTVGLHSMSIDNVLNLTMYQLYDLIERFSLYTSWDIDLRARMAGAKNDKPVEDWMRSLHSGGI